MNSNEILDQGPQHKRNQRSLSDPAASSMPLKLNLKYQSWLPSGSQHHPADKYSPAISIFMSRQPSQSRTTSSRYIEIITHRPHPKGSILWTVPHGVPDKRSKKQIKIFCSGQIFRVARARIFLPSLWDFVSLCQTTTMTTKKTGLGGSNWGPASIELN